MNSQEKGNSFEIIVENFFVWLFEKIGFTVIKARAQKSGTQNGFDILITVSKNYVERRIFIECKNYESDLPIGNILKKAMNLESNFTLDHNDLFIAINPKSKFSNDDIPEKLDRSLNEKFKFKYYALDTTNWVQNLFGLNNTFFKQIYGHDVDFAVDEEKEIERFKNIIFSRKPFRKFIISEIDKIKFIGDITPNHEFIRRELLEDSSERHSSIRNKSKEQSTLSAILAKEKKIFVLGNPGCGKTQELYELALQNWRVGETEGYLPIFRSLRDFTTSDDIEKYLPSESKDFDKILLILDGIDEIADIEYFKSKLNTFLNAQDSLKDFKVVISCRTNVYESIVKDISGFKKFYLKDFTRHQSLMLLENFCGVIVETLSFDEPLYDFMKTPFQIKILASYINQHQKLPTRSAELWETYIDARLTHDRNDKLKKVVLNIPIIRKYSNRLALINELMKSNAIAEDNLFALIDENSVNFDEFKKNPLIDKMPESENYFFEHRNIQEYFAARCISGLGFEEIKQFILIEGTNKTHPSLFNTITFLLSILQDDRFDLLANWLIQNEPELLFKADNNRTSNFKVQVFQKYFQSECIDKTFWITHNKTFTTKEIAGFGDCEDNLEYLMTIIRNPENHFRVVISALELLGFFTISDSKMPKIKTDLFELLKKYPLEATENVKAHIIDCIYDLNLCNNDTAFLKEIFELFKDETNKQINRSLLSLIENYDPIDDFFWYIKAEFLREKKIVERTVKDNVIRGNSWALESLVIRLNSSDNFIELVRYYFDEANSSYSDNRFAEEIIKRFLYFEKGNEDVLTRLLASFENPKKYYFREDLLKNILLQSNAASQVKAFEFIIENFDFGLAGYFLASIVNDKTIQTIIEKFVTGGIKITELDFFRNVMVNHGNWPLANEFTNAVNAKGLTFNQRLLSEEEISNMRLQYSVKPQANFNLLFDKEKMLSEIEAIFIKNGSLIDSKKISEIEREWYDKNGHGNKIDISYRLLSRLIYENHKELAYEEIVDILQDQSIIIGNIKAKIEGLNNNGNKFEIYEAQKEYIYNWCKTQSEKIDFNKILGFLDFDRFSILEDYYSLKNILFFTEYFEFELTQEFLLNSMEFFDIDKASTEDETFEKLSRKINDKQLFDQRIIHNLLNKNLGYISLSKHIQYALDKNLVSTFPVLKNYFANANYSYEVDGQLRQLHDLTNDTPFLIECCTDVKTHKCWTALKILRDKKLEKDFCIQKATEYLDTKIDTDKNYYYTTALSILFESNSIQALKYVMDFLDMDTTPSLKESSFQEYDAIDDYNILNSLFEKIFLGDRDHIGYSGMSSFLTHYISNLSKRDKGYQKTLEVLSEMKIKFETEQIDTGTYFINKLIDDAVESYINSKSKVLNFKEALLRAGEILN